MVRVSRKRLRPFLAFQEMMIGSKATEQDYLFTGRGVKWKFAWTRVI